MNLKTTTLFVIGSSLLLGACKFTLPAATTTTTPTPTEISPTITATPSPKNLNSLNQELDQTIDDGGQADLKNLQKDASGL